MKSANERDPNINLEPRHKKRSMREMESTGKPLENKRTDSSDSDSDAEFTRFVYRQKRKGLKKDAVQNKNVPPDRSSASSLSLYPIRKPWTRKCKKFLVPIENDTEGNDELRDVRNSKISYSCTGTTKTRAQIHNAASVSDLNRDDVMIVDSDMDVIPAAESYPTACTKIGNASATADMRTTLRLAELEVERRTRNDAQNLNLNLQLIQTNTGEKLNFVLNWDKASSEPLLTVDPAFVKSLKPHQFSGIKFLWEACYVSLDAVKKNDRGRGCVLAHSMGLGKTLQTIAFLHTVLSNEACKTKSALIICPLNIVVNWYNEFEQWCKDCKVRPRVHRLWDAWNKHSFGAFSDWQRTGGVGIIHYEAFRLLANLHQIKSGRPTKETQQLIETTLLHPGPDVVVCDEGHLLKNTSTKTTAAVMKINTLRRIVLTGTPLQNHLMEFYTLLSFVRPNFLIGRSEFKYLFRDPIETGRTKNCDIDAGTLMMRRAHVLQNLFTGYVHRLHNSVLASYLPPKFDYAIFINLSRLQKDIYKSYLDHRALNSTTTGGNFLMDYHVLVKIVTHPILIPNSRNYSSREAERDSFDASFEDSEDISFLPSSDWFSAIVDSYKDLTNEIELSGKMVVLISILKSCALVEDKILIFSQFLTSLDLIEEVLLLLDKEAEMKANDELFSSASSTSPEQQRWRKYVEFYRIDGNTHPDARQYACDTFNNDNRAKLFLISTKAGGLGINLTGANRVILFDPSWNPAHDTHSVFRVFRFGQTKPCYIYRLLAHGTIDEKVYNRQIQKLSLSCRVFDEHQNERHLEYEEIKDMYDFNANDEPQLSSLSTPKDKLLADLLVSHKDWIFNYLEHDALLENKKERELTSDEQQEAWDEFKIETAQGRYVGTQR